MRGIPIDMIAPSSETAAGFYGLCATRFAMLLVFGFGPGDTSEEQRSNRKLQETSIAVHVHLTARLSARSALSLSMSPRSGSSVGYLPRSQCRTSFGA
jgi:hypothetical protein